MPTRQEVFAAIESELDYQLAMSANAHGDPAEEGRKKLEQFVLYMEDYLHECRSQLSRTWGPDAYDKALNTLRKVVAIGVSGMVVHGAPHRVTPTPHADGTDLVGKNWLSKPKPPTGKIKKESES